MVVLALFLLQPTVHANVEITPSISSTLRWTDNRSLTSGELQEEDIITQVQPELTLSVDSRRHQVMLNTSYQYFTYYKANETREFQQYHASTTSELVDDLLFFDFIASKSQNAALQQNTVAADNFSLTTNRTNVESIAVHPFLLKQWTPRWRTQVDYNYKENNYKAVGLEDNQVQGVTALMGYDDEDLRMDLSYSGTKTESDRLVTPANFNEVRLNTHYQVNGSWAWLLNAGYEDNQYEQVTSEKTKGSFGEVGLEVALTRKITFNGMIGERYFGNTSSLRLLYTYNRESGLEIAHRNDITQKAVGLLQSAEPAAAVNQFNGLENISLLTEVYKVSRSHVRIYTQWPRSRGELMAIREIRDFQLSLNREKVNSVTANWRWTITAKSTLKIDLSLRDRAIDNQPGNDRLLYTLMKLETQPIKNFLMGGEYGVSSRSGGAFQAYRQSQFGLFAKIIF